MRKKQESTPKLSILITLATGKITKTESQHPKGDKTAHRKYIQDIVSNDLKENPKGFYAYKKK